MRKLPLPHNQYALVDNSDFDYFNQFKWCLSAGYPSRRKWFKKTKTSLLVYLHREIFLDAKEIDHINGNRLDNRRANLRECDSSQNKCNRGLSSRNTSGFKGVSWNKKNKKWTVRIQKNGTYYHVGVYTDIRKAAQAYNEAAKELHGEYAKLNML